MKKKLAIIGASYLQVPLIEKANSLGIETHVFAWAANDVGEKMADYFYPISIVDKEEILFKCKEIEIDGICSIASDLAMVTVNYIADKMHLIGNSIECTLKSTNKHQMKLCFAENGDPSPKSIYVSNIFDLDKVDLRFPVIVKPVDRSGSRGITKLYDKTGLSEAIENAKNHGFEKMALVEEFVDGQEYSVECISYRGNHFFLAMTLKYTTGAPHFIETGHLEPAPVSNEVLEKVKSVVFHALSSLGVENGASHSEVKVDSKGNVQIIEIGARMGGDMIGSSLVQLSTGYDFVNGVIDVALGNAPNVIVAKKGVAAVRFVFDHSDIEVLDKLKREHSEYSVMEDIKEITSSIVTDSSSRFGYFLMKADTFGQLKEYLPVGRE